MESANNTPAEEPAAGKPDRARVRKVFSRTVTAGLAFALAFNAPLSMPGERPTGLAYAATISVDGSAGDWDGSDLASGSGVISTWGATTDGANLYLVLEGNSGNGSYADASGVSLASANLNGTFNVQLNPGSNTVNRFALNWNDIAGAGSAVTGDSSGNYVFEASIPLSSLGGSSATVSYNGATKTIQYGDASDAGQSTDSGQGQDTGSDAGAGTSTDADNGSGASTDASSSGSSSGSATNASTSAATGNPTVDGNLDDWDTSTSNTASGVKGLTNWKIARGADGNYYFAAWGMANAYVGHDWDQFQVGSQGYGFTQLKSNGGSYVSVNNGNGNTEGPHYVECMIPASMMNAGTFTFGGTTINVADIPAYVAPTPEDDPGRYNGITIDGKFKDWKYVQKTDAKNPNPAAPNDLSQVAMVFDGDVYVYIKEGDGGSAAGAGTHGNGKYSITSDLGRENVFQLNQDGTVSGIPGAEAKHVGSEWEIRIPRESLNYYGQSLNFGLYQSEPFVSNVTDLQNNPNNSGKFQGITYDGKYDDWNPYPVTTISYATAGTQDKNEDASAALYADGSTLYMYAETSMQAHIDEQRKDGTAFTKAITIDLTGKASDEQDIDVNGEDDLSPRIIAVDENGNIDWNPDLTNQPDGTTREYAIVETHGTYDTNSMTNVSNKAFQEMGGVLGHVMITVNGDKCQAEYKIDLNNVAKMHNYYRKQHGKAADDSPDNYQFISARFGRLGNKIVTTTGASTGPWGALALSGIAVAGGLLANRRRARRRQDLPDAGAACR
ncbi:MAG: hypothetical protein LKJ49_08705 [Olsenella sp.]|jgi:hypothetical protein|nr:hypothetical protein [Olsenella sp.]